MADPLSVLSIAASVAGLLQVAGKLSGAISKLISTVTIAPTSARAALGTIENVRMVLSSVQKLLENGLGRVPENRKKMIHISKLVIIFRECIISLSELEAIVDLAAKTDGKRTIGTRFKWMCKQENFLRCVQQLESHKTSLSAMLSILHCESDLEAQQCLRSLQDSFSLLVQQHQDILRRFEEHNHNLRSDNASTRFFDDDGSTVRPRTDDIASEPSNEATVSAAPCPGIRFTSYHSESTFRDFENTLNATRVYRRAQAEQCDNSFTESATRSHGWSALSDLSLSEVSIISVIALPITLDEINSIGANLTFAKIFAPPPVLTAFQPKPPIKLLPSTPSRLGFLDSYNIVILGDSAAETTALTLEFCRGQGFLKDFLSHHSYQRQMNVDGKPCVLEVHDTGTSFGLSALQNQYMQAGDGFVVMYSICNRGSFASVNRFEADIARIPNPQWCGSTILIGNHWHRGAERQVSTQEALGLAEQLGWGFAEVSTEKKLNVEQAFVGLVRTIRSRRTT